MQEVLISCFQSMKFYKNKALDMDNKCFYTIFEMGG